MEEPIDSPQRGMPSTLPTRPSSRRSPQLHSPRWPWLGAASAVGAVLLAFSVGQAKAGPSYSSPFKLNLFAPSSWWSDFPTRLQAIDNHTVPALANWYQHDYTNGAKNPPPSWGPTNPQLYSVPQAGFPDPSGAQQLSYDRTGIAYSVPLQPPEPTVPTFTWATQRLLAAAQSLIGTPYQHLHLPTFDPGNANLVANHYYDWNKVSNNPSLQSTLQLLSYGSTVPGTQPNPYLNSYGFAEPGIDCTDFTAYVYSLALGYQMHSGTSNQVTFSGPGLPSGQVGGIPEALVLDTNGQAVTPTFFTGPNFGTGINRQGDLDNLIKKLQPGDLLYIGPSSGILHVVMWLGPLGINSDGTPSTVPLVISSHDNTPAIFTTQDISYQKGALFGFPSDGQIDPYLPPPGVQILPFTTAAAQGEIPNNWFYTNFQVAMRLLPTQPAAPVPAPAAPIWLAAPFLYRARRLRRRALRQAAPLSSQPGQPRGED